MFPPVTAALLSALGSFRDSGGGLTPLESDKAREVLEFYGDLIHRHRLLKIGDFDFGHTYRPASGALDSEPSPSRTSASSLPTIASTHFPRLESGRNPTNTFHLGIVKPAKDPEVAYDALRHLYSALAPNSTLPPFRVDAAGIRELMPELNGDDENVLLHLLENAAFDGSSRSESEALRDTLVRDVLLGDTDPAEGLRSAVQEMQELQAGG